MSGNVMRHEYRELDEGEKADMLAIKDLGETFYDFIEQVDRERGTSRERSLAKTKIEEAVMWATKSITGRV